MERPILFSTDMVKAILEGKKTVTRRVVKNKYENAEIKFFENKYGKRLVHMENDTEPLKNTDGTTSHKIKAFEEIRKPYEVGDILYVRETWSKQYLGKEINGEAIEEYVYKADGTTLDNSEGYVSRWYPSIHMPKDAARIFLRVKSVRAERLNCMSIQDFISEGIREFTKDGTVFKYAASEEQYSWRHMPREHKQAFKDLWDSTLKKSQMKEYSWDANPWVWVVEFEKLERA